MRHRYRLRWRGHDIGEIRSRGEGDYPFIHGDFLPIDLDDTLRAYFAYMATDDPDPPFSDEVWDQLSDGENWSLVDEAGCEYKITAPAVPSEGRIAWMLRS